MAKASMHFAYYLFLLTFCIDKGDGRWKKTDREILQRDINLYKKIAERVEHELQEYEDYVDHEFEEHHTDRSNNQRDKSVPNDGVKSKEDKEGDNDIKRYLPYQTRTNDIPLYNKLNFNDSILIRKINQNNYIQKPKSPENKWPKFDDILLAMGKKYDWKNDRWIKVKEKFKSKDKVYLVKNDNSVIFHEKHHFSYSSVKLNRGKNRRNVVIAVTAIR